MLLKDKKKAIFDFIELDIKDVPVYFSLLKYHVYKKSSEKDNKNIDFEFKLTIWKS